MDNISLRAADLNSFNTPLFTWSDLLTDYYLFLPLSALHFDSDDDVIAYVDHILEV